MSTRREFLTAAPLREALQQTAEEPAMVPVSGNTIRLSKTAMACDFEVILNPGGGKLLGAASDALDEIDRLEDQLSIYRPDSELSQLNARGASEPVFVERQLLVLLRETLQYAAEFDGAYDPTAGPLVALWRMCRRERRVPTPEELNDARGRLGFRDVQIDLEQGTLCFLRPGVELNLNAIGKGYALDRAVETLMDQGAPVDSGRQPIPQEPEATGPINPPFPTPIEGPGCSGVCPPPPQPSPRQGGREKECSGSAADSSSATKLPEQPALSLLIHGGYSSIIARGALTGMEGWPIAIRHPLVPNRTLATILLRDRAVSTSGSAVQFFRVGDRRFGHILDPRTGWPAEEILSVTVLAPTAARAEALSTAFFVAGVEKAREYCHNQTDVAALIIPAPVGGKTLEPVIFGIPEEDLIWESDG